MAETSRDSQIKRFNVELWDISKPVPYSKNARINDKAIDPVAKSIKEYGWRQPIVVDKNGVIVIGHTRLLAAKKLGLNQVPVHIADNLSDAKIKALRIADNKTSEYALWNIDLLNEELKELKEIDLNFVTDFFPEKSLDLTTNLDFFETVDKFKNLIIKPFESFQSSALYGLPELRDDKMSDFDLSDVVTFSVDINYTNTSFIHVPLGVAHVEKVDNSRAFYSFYATDDRFEKIYMENSAWLARMINRKIENIVMPNFSMWFNWPQALRIHSCYKARFVARCAQEVGINVIPDIQGHTDDLHFIFSGMPKSCNVIACQAQTDLPADGMVIKLSVIREALKYYENANMLVIADQKRYQQIYKNIGSEFQKKLINVKTLREARRLRDRNKKQGG